MDSLTKLLSLRENIVWPWSEKVGLKFNIQITKIITSGPTTLWEIDGGTLEPVSNFILGAPKLLQMVTATMKLKEAYSLEGKL